MSSTTSDKGKKRKASETIENHDDDAGDSGDSGETKFQSIVRTFMKNQNDNQLDWLSANGIPDYDVTAVEGSGSLTDEARGHFTEEMSDLLNSWIWGTIVHLKESDDGGYFVPTLKSGKDVNRSKVFYEEVENGPLHYVSANPSQAEGEEEREIKKKARRLHGFNKADLSRSCSIGGAISASPDAKELLGHLMHLRRAHLIQLSMIAATSEKKKTIKKKHVQAAIASDGITVV
jgi:histone H3/H4